MVSTVKHHSHIRAFFAIDIDKALKDAIKAIQTKLKKDTHAMHLRWSNIDNLHITLRFFSQLETNKIEPLLQTVAERTNAISPFEIELGNVVLFPPHNPRMIAIKVVLNNELATLVNVTEKAAQRVGFEPEKRGYLPHITLARPRDDKLPNLSALNFSLPPLFIDHFTLYQSKPSPQGSAYNALRQLGLRKA